MFCANCKYNDGLVYTSFPVQYKCTIDNTFYRGDHQCDKEFVPAKKGIWKIHGSYHDSETNRIEIIFRCSLCCRIQGCITDYCADCGANMEEEVEDE